MGNRTEGMILSTYRSAHSPWGPRQGDSRIEASRFDFVDNIQRAIGHLVNHPRTPIGIKPTLQRLLLECDHYLMHGNEDIFIKLCLDAIDVCGQGWSYLSCWVSRSQNICYSIYWALKEALDKHQKSR